MPSSNLPLIQTHHPSTFLERGVSVPCTTPMLLGARARPSERSAVEVIVPNPSGGRGVYILPWASVTQLCRPTVHDTVLFQLIVAQYGITPAGIRAAARTVAAQGLAGHPAAAAAAVADTADARDRLAATTLVMLAAIRQNGAGAELDPAIAASPPVLELHAREAIARIAPRLGRGVDAIFNDMKALAETLIPIGFDAQDPPARVPRLLADIVCFRDEALHWSRQNADPSGPHAAFAATLAGVTIDCADVTLAEARAGTQDIARLLGEWVASPDAVARRLGRSEWLVDGWEQICRLWQGTSTRAARHAAMAEISLLVPVLPKEAATWFSQKIDLDDAQGLSRIVPADTDWRTGQHFERVARNEALRAMAA